jgi:hypothetical protein
VPVSENPMTKKFLCLFLLVPLMSACGSDKTNTGSDGSGGSSSGGSDNGDTGGSSSGGDSSSTGAQSSSGGATNGSGGDTNGGSGGTSSATGGNGNGGKDGGVTDGGPDSGGGHTTPDAGKPDGAGGVIGTGACCTTHESVGCNTASIQECVCKPVGQGGDPECCTKNWNAACVALVGSLGCGTTCKQDCCTQASTPGCADQGIETCVCKKYPACCSGKWDDFCVELVGSATASGSCGPVCS